MRALENLLSGDYSKEDIVALLKSNSTYELFTASKEYKRKFVGNKTYLRGLIELSNICSKNCYYCGIRSANTKVERYTLDQKQVINACKYAYGRGYGSLVLQTGERDDPKFIDLISETLELISKNLPAKMRITLSCGEQSKETYLKWKKLGADRYLLRIEASNPYLYKQLHPNDHKHSFEQRLRALEALKECGYQVGSGFMVGVPGQSLEDIASDILFLRDFKIDMIGMGPYVPGQNTPIAQKEILHKDERFLLALKAIAILRITMPDVNIAAATALQALEPMGREKALDIGANVIMPNITPPDARKAYGLYDNKPLDSKGLEDRDAELFKRIEDIGDEVVRNEFGDSLHYNKRIGKGK